MMGSLRSQILHIASTRAPMILSDGHDKKVSCARALTTHIKLLLRLREHPISDPAANVKGTWSAKRTLGDVETNHPLLEVP